MSLIFTTLFVPATAGVLFVDLNNAPQEYGACMDGAGDDNVSVVSQQTSETGERVGVQMIERKLRELEAMGQPADSIVLSCHQGAGTCFGDYGEITATQLTAMLNRNPRSKRSVRSLGMINCYGGNVEAAEADWILPNPGVQQVFGFPTQSPTKTARDTATLVKDFCKNRREYASRSTKQELCEIYPRVAGLTKQSVALCSREAIASSAYGPKACYGYDELHQRCAEFDPGEQSLVRYMSYMYPEDACGPFKSPPADKNSAYENGASPLRSYYNQVHLWRHCVEQIKADRGYEMPQATRLIRLIKYDTIKENLARLNARELADYDEKLGQLCLDQFKLGDITKLSRFEMNYRIEGAVRALTRQTNPVPDDGLGEDEPVSSLDGPTEPARAIAEATCRPPARQPGRVCPSKTISPRVVAKMATLMQQTFVDLSYRSGPNGTGRSCSNFHLVEQNAPERFKSQCIVDYRTAISL